MGLVDCHDPLPIFYVTVPLFVNTEQLLYHCIFICSDVHWRLLIV